MTRDYPVVADPDPLAERVLACPFCGHPPVHRFTGNPPTHWYSCWNPECRPSGGSTDPEAALEQWNRRADLERLRRIAAAAASVLECVVPDLGGNSVICSSYGGKLALRELRRALQPPTSNPPL